jgi:hypothetical protein
MLNHNECWARKLIDCPAARLAIARTTARAMPYAADAQG